jgi:multiple sugar transport system substrate-binding protein
MNLDTAKLKSQKLKSLRHNIPKIIMAVVVILIIFLLVMESVTISEESGETPVVELFGEKSRAFGDIIAPEDFDWRQYEGVVLDFIVENNINANILYKESETFTEKTGIKVNIRSMDFNTMSEKISMDFISKSGAYELIYVDPYQTLQRFHNQLEDLNRYEKDEKLPHIVNGLDEFKEEHLEVCSYIDGNHDKLYAIPFDSTSMIMFYRKDIFEKYKDAMVEDLGYEPIPGSSSFTWERYSDVSKWISANVPKDEIQYGSLTMSAKHNSIYTEFSTILAAYGADYFVDDDMATFGTPKEKFIDALRMYKSLAMLNPQDAEDSNWSMTNEAFQNGEVAMMVNWDENAAAVENQEYSKVSGKVGYSILPFGTSRSANIYGGSGIGINANISDEKKLASWLFIVWATSPYIQTKIMLEEDGGNMPTRMTLNRLIEAQYMAKLPHAYAAIRSQDKKYAYYRPKLEQGYEFETLMEDELYRMLEENLNEETVYDEMSKGWERILSQEKLLEES